jgi:hypothetical protein
MSVGKIQKLDWWFSICWIILTFVKKSFITMTPGQGAADYCARAHHPLQLHRLALGQAAQNGPIKRYRNSFLMEQHVLDANAGKQLP